VINLFVKLNDYIMTELTDRAIATEQDQIKALEEEYQKRT